jgi:copper chaperone CopZ
MRYPGHGRDETKMTLLTLNVEGMSCGHCLNAVSRALRGLPGVDVQSVAIGQAKVAYDPGAIDPARIAAAITAAGYPATPIPA